VVPLLFQPLLGWLLRCVVRFFLPLFSPSATHCFFLWTIQCTDALQHSCSYQTAAYPPFHARSSLSVAGMLQSAPLHRTPGSGVQTETGCAQPLVPLTPLPPSTLPVRGAAHGSTNTLSKAICVMNDATNARNVSKITFP